jgi:hypothetical protein
MLSQSLQDFIEVATSLHVVGIHCNQRWLYFSSDFIHRSHVEY